MTNTEPNVKPTERYNLQQVADLLGVSRRTIYYWEERGRITRTWNKFGGYFTGLNIIKAWKGI